MQGLVGAWEGSPTQSMGRSGALWIHAADLSKWPCWVWSFVGEQRGDRCDEASTQCCSWATRGHGWTSARWLQCSLGTRVLEGLRHGLGSSRGDTGRDSPVGSVPQSQLHPRLAEPRAQAPILSTASGGAMGAGFILRRGWQAGCPSPGHRSRLCEVWSDSCSYFCLDSVPHPHLLLPGCPSSVSLGLSILGADWEDDA